MSYTKSFFMEQYGINCVLELTELRKKQSKYYDGYKKYQNKKPRNIKGYIWERYSPSKLVRSMNKFERKYWGFNLEEYWILRKIEQ